MELFTTAQAAEFVGCTGATIGKYRERGFVKGVLHGSRWRYSADELIIMRKKHGKRPKRRLRKKEDLFLKDCSLCWKCINAYNGCSWVREQKPVAGWTANEVRSVSGAFGGYIVKDCPEFEKEEFFTVNGVVRRVNEVPMENLTAEAAFLRFKEMMKSGGRKK